MTFGWMIGILLMVSAVIVLDVVFRTSKISQDVPTEDDPE